MTEKYILTFKQNIFPTQSYFTNPLDSRSNNHVQQHVVNLQQTFSVKKSEMLTTGTDVDGLPINMDRGEKDDWERIHWDWVQVTRSDRALYRGKSGKILKLK